MEDELARTTRHRRPWQIATALVTLGAVPVLCPAATHGRQVQAAATSCRTLAFDHASVDRVGGAGGTARYRLTVSGTKPSVSMTVSLNPHTYARQPQYWGIDVTGCAPDIGLPAIGRYRATRELTGTMGTCGIAVVGTNGTRRFDLTGCR